MTKMTFEKAMEMAVPFVEDNSKEMLEQMIISDSKFKEDFEKDITPKYEEEMNKKGVFFVINDVSWKRGSSYHPIRKTLRLGHVGREKLPLISFNVF